MKKKKSVVSHRIEDYAKIKFAEFVKKHKIIPSLAAQEAYLEWVEKRKHWKVR